jgi:Prolyl oligopeptidase family
LSASAESPSRFRHAGPLATFGLALMSLVGGGCRFVPVSPEPRAPAPLSQEIQDLYSIPGIESVPGHERSTVCDSYSLHEGMVRIEGQELDYRFYLPPEARQHRVPFMLIVPILAGGEGIVDFIGKRMVAQGIAAGAVERPGPGTFLGEEHDDRTNTDLNWGPEELKNYLVKAIRNQRAFLSFMQEQEGIDPEKLSCVGISLGGILATKLAAVEPRLDSAALCLAGGDMVDIMMHTTEGGIVEWGRGFMEREKIGPRELERRLMIHPEMDPASLARHVDANKVLLITADFDTTVPAGNGDFLWECLGRPERSFVPAGHYTSIVAIFWMCRRVGEFAKAHDR